MHTNEVIKKIIADLAMVSPNVPVEKIAIIVDSVLTEWSGSIEKKITEMVRDWEDRMPDDDTLYSLGLRRALDVVRGQDPDDLTRDLAR
ncbi:hypothetical protein [Actinomycetia phage DSL-LC01]|nr:hypothetical protein [Actinomycetia phage DSL-LC01]